MRSHSIFEQLDSLKVEDLQRVKDTLQGYRESKNYSSGVPFSRFDEFGDLVTSIPQTVKEDIGLGVAVLKEVVPGIYTFAKSLSDVMNSPAKVNPDAQIAGDDVLFFMICFAREQIKQQVGPVASDEKGAEALQRKAIELKAKADLVADIVSLIDPTLNAAYAMATLMASIEYLVQNGVASPEKLESKESEAQGAAYTALAQALTRADLENPGREAEVDLTFGQEAYEVMLEPKLDDLKNIISTYQEEEIGTLQKLLKKAGLEAVGIEETREGEGPGSIRTPENDRPRTMAEIIGILDDTTNAGHAYYAAAINGDSGLKTTVDKCRFFVECKKRLGDQTKTVVERVSDLQGYVQAPENVKVVEQHRRNALLDYIMAFFTFGYYGGRSHSKLVVNKQMKPELKRLDRFFQPAPPAGDSKSYRHRVNMREWPSEGSEPGAAEGEQKRTPGSRRSSSGSVGG